MNEEQRAAKIDEAMRKLNSMIATIEYAAENAKVIDKHFDQPNIPADEQRILERT